MTRAVVDGDGARRADLAAIHVAKKALGWDDDAYRDILFAVCRVRSSAELDFTGRKRFLAHLKSCQLAAGASPRPATVRPGWSQQKRLIWSLWQQLADAGLTHERSARALNAWIKRQTGVDRIDWLNGRQCDLCIESLKLWLTRARG